MRNIIYLLLLFCTIGFGQSPLVIASKHQAGGGPSYGTEQYTVGNALATGGSEVDGVVGLTNFGGGLDIMESLSSSPSPQDGSHLVHIKTSSQPDRMEEELTLTTGTIYKIEYWAWATLTVSGRSNLWVGFEASSGAGWEATPSFYYTTTPTKYTHILKTSASEQTLRFYMTNNSADGYIDGLSIKEVL